MSITTTYDSTKKYLHELLDDIQKGKTQLPDFQRGWVWNDEHIRSLLASISLSYPIGAVMLLETGNPDVKFKPRAVEGVKLDSHAEPEQLVLDGQQRLTSLFQSICMGQAVTTRDIKGKEIRRWYYINMDEMMAPNGDREDAIISLPEDRIIKNFRGEVLADYSTPENEYEHGMFPLHRVFGCSEWRWAYSKYWDHQSDKADAFDRFERDVIKRFEQYQVPIIELKKATPKVAVCQVFEKVNTGGVSLTVFELLTATFAADDYNLRDDWSARSKALAEFSPILKGIEATDFLQALTLLASHNRHQADPKASVTCKRRDVLAMTLKDYQQHADAISDGLKRAAKLLHSQKVFSARDLPYKTQLVPLAAIFAALGDDLHSDTARSKIIRWYWCGVFGELYGGAIETRFAKDLPDVLAWIRGDSEPTTVSDAQFAQSRLRNLRTRNSAAYKGLSALLMRDGGLDFRTGEPIESNIYFDEAVDIHHIFPKRYCGKKTNDELSLDVISATRGVIDCIVNKTPLSSSTNRMIGAKAPSDYLDDLETKRNIPQDRINEMLESHLIDPDALWIDDFAEFFEKREEALIGRIESAMGKSVNRDLADAGEAISM